MNRFRSYERSRRWSAIGIVFAVVASGCDTSSDRRPTAYERYDHDAESYDGASPSRTLHPRDGDERRATKSLRFDRTTDELRAARNEISPTRGDDRDAAPIATPIPAHVVTTAEAEAALPELPPRVVAPRSTTAVAPVPSAPISYEAAVRRAAELNARGFGLVVKCSWFSARTDFVQALRLTAEAFDSREGAGRRTQALDAGMTALAEAEDFVAHGAVTMNGEPDAILRLHRTSMHLGPFGARSMPHELHETYVAFAQEQLAAAAAGSSTAITALHGLGKTYAAVGDQVADARAKARACYRAVLAAEPSNFLAANDLAVLLAEEGRYEQARDILHAALRTSSQPAMWRNLAVVHDRLGQPQWAQLARLEADAVAHRAGATGGVLPTHNVAWLDPQSFAAVGRGRLEIPVAPAAATAQRTASAAAAPPVQSAVRPTARLLGY